MTLLWFLLFRQNDILSQPKKTEGHLGMSSSCSHWASAKEKPFKLCCQSTSHNGRHLTATESLLLLSCDYFIVYYCFVAVLSHICLTMALFCFSKENGNLLIYTAACMQKFVCVWVRACHRFFEVGGSEQVRETLHRNRRLLLRRYN